MTDWTGWEWVAAGIAALCIGMSKTGLGGLGMVAIVIMAAILPARESTGMILTLLIVADVFAVSVFRRHANWGMVLRLLPAAVAGIVSGYFLMPHVPDGIFRPMMGWITLILIGMLVMQRQRPQWAERAAERGAVAAGWLGGVVTMLANAAGPVLSIYLLACRLPKLEFVGTAAWFFFVVNVVKVPFSASMGLVNPDSLRITLALAPVVLIGGVAGRWVLGKLNQRWFENILIAFTAIGALRLILA